MKLSHGGHLSHGDPASITSRIYRFNHYGVNPNTELLDKKIFSRGIDRAVFPGTQGAPNLSLVAGKAVCFKQATTPQFIQIQRATLQNAQILADELRTKGYRLVTGGTDNHLVLIHLKSKGLKGNVAERALEQVGILANRNVIPYDSESTLTTSGLRMGTQAITARGLREEEVREICKLIDQTLSADEDESVKMKVREKVQSICFRFPIYT